MKYPTLLLVSALAIGCASSNELAGFSSCEKVPVLEDRLAGYTASRDAAQQAVADDNRDEGAQAGLSRWHERVRDTAAMLKQAKEACEAGSI